MSNPISVAETAGLLARRRRVGKFVVFLSGAALVATISISLFVTQFGRQVMGADRRTLLTETFKLSCLSPEQAADIISPYIRSNGSTYYVSTSGLTTITVRGKPEELRTAGRLLRQFESDPQAACRHSPFDKVDEILKRFGGPPPHPSDAPVLAPSPDAAPPAKKK